MEAPVKACKVRLAAVLFFCASLEFICVQLEGLLIILGRPLWILQVEWGEPTMILAERLLIIEALQDPLNEKFFLLSDRHVGDIFHHFNYCYSLIKLVYALVSL